MCKEYENHIRSVLINTFFINTAILFQGSDITKRNLVLPLATYQRAAESIRRYADFTFTATVRQQESNIGTIISFSNGENR